MKTWLYRRWRLVLIWLSYRVPRRLERWLVECVLYGDGTQYAWADVYRLKMAGVVVEENAK